MERRVFEYHKAIEQILRTDAKARDHDIYLYAKLIMGAPWYTDLDALTGRSLLARIHRKELPHFESVRRTRQKLQENDPSLRGEKRHERMEREKKWRNEIRTGIPDQDQGRLPL